MTTRIYATSLSCTCPCVSLNAVVLTGLWSNGNSTVTHLTPAQCKVYSQNWKVYILHTSKWRKKNTDMLSNKLFACQWWFLYQCDSAAIRLTKNVFTLWFSYIYEQIKCLDWAPRFHIRSHPVAYSWSHLNCFWGLTSTWICKLFNTSSPETAQPLWAEVELRFIWDVLRCKSSFCHLHTWFLMTT